jgi:thioredoxin reductase
MPQVPLLIIGAGPFGLALAAWARQQGLEHIILGEPMEFWKKHMPKGMLLRSGFDWHLDPFGEHTFHRYLETRGLAPAEAEPISLELYLDHCEWFRREKGIEVHPGRVQRLDATEEGLAATLENGEVIQADNVALAIGFRHFVNIPDPYPALFPPERMTHTCYAADLARYAGQRVLIIGGRQSAFEWAALLNELGARSVALSYRHSTPAFTRSEWDWIAPLIDGMVENPGWYRSLPREEKDQIDQRQWGEGRLKLEPWLWPRLDQQRIRLFPETTVVSSMEQPDGSLKVMLSDGAVLPVDQVILATGYKVDVTRIPMLARGNILERLKLLNGFPLLDDHLQSSVPGLFFTSMCAVQDFGPFFGFTVSARTSAKLIGKAVSLSSRPLARQPQP